MDTYQIIGTPTRRVDGAAKATGQARYAADVSLPGTLWGKSLHSPYAYARIVRLDTTAAQQVPGVHAVITGAEVRAGLWGHMVTCRCWPMSGCASVASVWTDRKN